MRSKFDLATALSTSRNGMTMKEMTSATGRNRSTVYRWLEGITLIFPQYTLEEFRDENNEVRRRLTLDSYHRDQNGRRMLGTISPSEIFVLEMAIDELRRESGAVDCDKLDLLATKLSNMLSRMELRKLEEARQEQGSQDLAPEKKRNSS